MRYHLANAAWGVLDYAAYPIGMLLLAPIILRNLGAAEYGVWTLVTAAISMGSIIAAGFGDANIQNVASERGRGRPDMLLRTVRCMISINLALGTALAIVAWMLAGHIAQHAVPSADISLRRDCLWSLRLASALIWIRTMESVCISTQRAFERYGSAVRISLAARLLSLLASAVLTYVARSVFALLVAVILFNVPATWLQFKRLYRLLETDVLAPMLDRRVMKAILGFGLLSWLQAVAWIVFGQADRIFLGVSYGAVAVASYALCAQMSQPIYGMTASGLHFMFPYLTECTATRVPAKLRRVIITAFAGNVLCVAIASAALVIAGPSILHTWAGNEIAKSSFRVLPTIVAGSALLGLNVTATYSLLALGGVRIVTLMNIVAGVIMLSLMVYLAPRMGAYGVAIARLSYGAIVLSLYVPLIRRLNTVRSPLNAMAAKPVCEEI